MPIIPPCGKAFSGTAIICSIIPGGGNMPAGASNSIRSLFLVLCKFIPDYEVSNGPPLIIFCIIYLGSMPPAEPAIIICIIIYFLIYSFCEEPPELPLPLESLLPSLLLPLFMS
jgi:hypothetical protein